MPKAEAEERRTDGTATIVSEAGKPVDSGTSSVAVKTEGVEEPRTVTVGAGTSFDSTAAAAGQKKVTTIFLYDDDEDEDDEL